MDSSDQSSADMGDQNDGSNMNEQNIPKECRICYETYEDDSNPLLSPCDCSGTMAYIHFQCLSKSIESNGEEICGICGQKWSGIQVMKKPKNFIEFLEENRILLFTMCPVIAILSGIAFLIAFIYSSIFHLKEEFLINYLIYFVFISSVNLIIYLMFIYFEYKEWRELNQKIIVVKN